MRAGIGAGDRAGYSGGESGGNSDRPHVRRDSGGHAFVEMALFEFYVSLPRPRFANYILEPFERVD